MSATHDDASLDALVAAIVAQFEAAGLAVERFDTHISTVILAGDFAYKFKKPVNFGFLDYSTLGRRRHYCELELALNARHAPDLYVDVLPVTAGPTLGGTGPVLEWTLRMRRFATRERLDIALAEGRVGIDDIIAIAQALAGIHSHAPGAPAPGRYGAPPLVRSQLLAGLEGLSAALPDVEAFVRALDAAFTARVAALEDRLQAGHVRDCHGDLHLTNLVRHGGQWQAFDCIEFDDELRYIDTASDLAFLLMDLDVRDRTAFANRLLNEYLAASGDYGLLDVIDFYLLYRTVVRAKVALLSARGDADDEGQARAARHLALAHRYLRPRAPPALILTHGVSGSGKSFQARRLADARGFVHLRSDVERKRHGGSVDARQRYARAQTDATYARLLQLATSLLDKGWSVIVDATFLTRERRAPFVELASRSGAPLTILDCDAPREILESRIVARQAAGTDPSDATVEVLAKQLAAREPLTEAELRHAIPAQDLDDARLATLPGGSRVASA